MVIKNALFMHIPYVPLTRTIYFDKMSHETRDSSEKAESENAYTHMIATSTESLPNTINSYLLAIGYSNRTIN